MEKTNLSKMELCFLTFGIIIGIVGILHGSAELLRGNEIVTGHSIEALPQNWPNIEFYSMTRGSPVFSIFTDLPFFALGLTAITISVAMIVFSAIWFRLNAKAIAIFAILSLGIFCFGAGRGTPIAMSLPMIIFAIIALARPTKKARSTTSQKTILTLFKFSYTLKILSWVLFFPGLFIFSFYHEIPFWLLVSAFASMPIAALAALTTALMLDRTAAKI